MANIYIVEVMSNDGDGEAMDYEYGNFEHAMEQYRDEDHASLIEYDGNEYHIVFNK